MAVGLSSAMAASRLNTYRGTNHTAVSVFLKLHTGDPGASAAANASAVTTRNAVTWNAPSAGSMTLSSIGTYAMTASETISHGSFWDASTAGNFLESFAFSAGVPVVNGSTLTISTLTISESPLAA